MWVADSTFDTTSMEKDRSDIERARVAGGEPGSMTSLGSPIRRATSMSSVVDWDVGLWEAPRPWSPKPLTPLGHKHNSNHLLTDSSREEIDSYYYGSPQVDFTPPKLPACAHSTPIVAPPAAELDTTGKSGNSSAFPDILPRDNISASSSSSGYSSNSSGLFQFSPTALTYLDGFYGDSSFDAIRVIGTPPSITLNSESPADVDGVAGLFADSICASREELEDLRPLGANSNSISTGEQCLIHGPSLGFSGGSSTVEAVEQNQPDVIVISPQKVPTLPPKSPHAATSPFPATPKSPASPTGSGPDTSKPKEPYFSLIAKVILQSQEHKLILGDIYDLILEKYPYFRTAELSWRNVIRHNLSVNDCFVKAGRAASGRGCFWAIHQSCAELFRRGDFRRREAKRQVQLWQELARSGSGKENRKATAAVSHGRVCGHVMLQATPTPAEVFRRECDTVHAAATASSGASTRTVTSGYQNYPGQYGYRSRHAHQQPYIQGFQFASHGLPVGDISSSGQQETSPSSNYR